MAGGGDLWIAFAAGAILAYGIGEGFSKEPTVRIGPDRMLVLYGLYELPAYLAWFFLFGGAGALNAPGVVFGMAAGLCGTVSAVLWYSAMETGTASVVSAFAAGYPVVTVVLAVLFLGSVLVPIQAAAVVLLIVSAVLVSVSERTPRGGPPTRRVAPTLLVIVVVWGLVGIFDKLAIGAAGYPVAAGMYGVGSAPIFVWAYLRARRGSARPGAFRDPMAHLMSILFTVGGLALLLAIGSGPVAVVVPLSAVYPVLTVGIRRFAVGERLSGPQKLAVGMAIFGAVLAGI
ncbi:MAG TPA: EamA family transporter [Thermoplasmata archaeon]|nr:EamA family transporter [Thermoplasmata archaeon]